MNSNTTKFKACEEAFERLKKGVPIVKELKGMPITPSLVSKEAGHDKGYLKRKRPSHEVLIYEIDTFNKSRTESLEAKLEGMAVALAKEKKKADDFEKKYNKALEHELLMFKQLCVFEEKIAQLERLK